jgi:hypothetical protein
MRIIGQKPSLFSGDAIQGGMEVRWSRDRPEEVKAAEEIFQRHIMDGWFAFTEVGGRRTQIFSFDKNLDLIVLAPIMFGG